MNRITRKLLSLPALKAHKSTIFLLHGLGDIGRSYFPIAEYLRNKLPNSKFVMPTAGKIPVTLNMGIPMNAWYDIETLKSRDTKEPKYLESSAKSLIRLMESESKLFEKDVDPQFVFAGFSQGAALSFFTAMRRCERKIAAVAMLSGYLIKQQGIEKDLCGINKETPVLMCHGDSDPVVLTEWGKSSYEKLKKLGVNVKFNLYNGLQHSIVLKELDDLGSWLAQILNQKKNDSSLIREKAQSERSPMIKKNNQNWKKSCHFKKVNKKVLRTIFNTTCKLQLSYFQDIIDIFLGTLFFNDLKSKKIFSFSDWVKVTWHGRLEKV